MRTVTIRTIDNKTHTEEVVDDQTITSDAQIFEDLWGESLVMWNGSAIHNEDGPAIKCGDVEQYWFAGIRYKNKQLWERRKNLISSIDEDGNRCWAHKDRPEELHRDDGGPAFEYKGGIRHEYWEHDLIHRDGLPAVIDKELGITQWYLDGELHNLEGPAIKNTKDDYAEYYINDNKYTESEFFEFRGPIKETVGDGATKWFIYKNGVKLLHNTSGPAYISAGDKKIWYENGDVHREDGPAIEDPEGNKFWYHQGGYHREDGPAIEWASGDKEWFHFGKRHREGGPSVEFENGNKEWWTDGTLICKDTAESVEYYNNEGKWQSPMPSIAAVTYENGSQSWYDNGALHRENGPAIVQPDGRQEWYIKGKRHNVSGPAIKYPSGRRAWYLNDARVTKKEFETYIKREKSRKNVNKDMNKTKTRVARDEIFYLIYAATHQAYLVNKSSELTAGTPFFGGTLKKLYADNPLVSAEEVERIMAFAVFSAESGYDVFTAKDALLTLQNLLDTNAFRIDSENPYSVYKVSQAILNVSENAQLKIKPSMARALEVAEASVGEPVESYQDFLWQYAPAQARAEDLSDSGSWAAPALSILAAAAVGALTGSAFFKKKKEVKKKVSKVEQIPAR